MQTSYDASQEIVLFIFSWFGSCLLDRLQICEMIWKGGPRRHGEPHFSPQNLLPICTQSDPHESNRILV